MTPPLSDRPSATVADLRAFLDELPELEVMPAPQARQFAGNVRRYLNDVGVLNSDTLTSLSLPDLAGLQQHARPRLSATTRATYNNQLRQAIAMVIARAADDPLWALGTRRRPPRPPATGARRPAGARRSPSRQHHTASARPPASTDPPAGTQPQRPEPVQPPASPPMITYPFPLRDGQRAELTLPAVLDTADATRLAAFITALAIDRSQTVI
ncbi:hypothetical protein AB0H43_13675 [Hamadaea sp. NPDC050747]|uniref:hypothetical protein n=1 Tax=Hamadaea sp. NPDC050747 TaxID=3155789 RepID=UPI0033ECC13F